MVAVPQAGGLNMKPLLALFFAIFPYRVRFIWVMSMAVLPSGIPRKVTVAVLGISGTIDLMP